MQESLILMTEDHSLTKKTITGCIWFRNICRALILASFSVPLTAHAAGGNNQIKLYIVQQSLISAFESVGTLAGVAFQVDPAVDKVVSGLSLRGDVAEIVAQLSRQDSLFYWFDGSRYIVTPISSLSRWTISSGNIDPSEVKKAVGSVALNITPDAIRIDPEQRLVQVTGPRELKEAIERALENATRWQADPVTIIRFGQTAR